MENAPLKHILLGLISTARSVDRDRLALLSDRDWHLLQKMATQHRLKPLLHLRTNSLELQSAIPENLYRDWEAAFRMASMRYLACQQTLAKLNRILAEGGVDFVALKGAWLARYAYSNPAERPLRDIDILVAPENATKAYALLQGAGFTRKGGYAMPLADALERQKHLPPVRCDQTRILVELHTRLIETPPKEEESDALSNVALLLGRREIREGVPYLSPTDTLLHLIVHAAYDHQFNNGPLTFNDVALMIQSARIDWERFWLMAKAGGWERGCLLILELVSYYHRCEDWRPFCPSTQTPNYEQIESAALLSLQDFESRGIIGIGAELEASQSWFARTAVFLRRAFPPIHILASFSGASETSFWAIRHYPRWLITQIGRLRNRNSQVAVNADVENAIRVRKWIYVQTRN